MFSMIRNAIVMNPVYRTANDIVAAQVWRSTHLHSRAYWGDFTSLREELQKRPQDLNMRDKKEGTPLDCAYYCFNNAESNDDWQMMRVAQDMICYLREEGGLTGAEVDERTRNPITINVCEVSEDIDKFPSEFEILNKNPNNLHDALGIFGVKDAHIINLSDIKAKYRQMSLKLHPDKWSELPELPRKAAAELFKKISSAYAIINEYCSPKSSSNEYNIYKDPNNNNQIIIKV